MTVVGSEREINEEFNKINNIENANMYFRLYFVIQ